jgi:hypothetical protein
VQGDFDRIRLRPLELGDLARRQVGALAESDQLAVTLLEACDRSGERDPPQRVVPELAVVGSVQLLGCMLELWRPALDAATCDPDQPRDRFALAGVVALAVAEGPLERLARQISASGPSPTR